ncbi:MAG: hypothetical protein COV07_00400 [Candidatus Vogelbacteria bacterium CG10_big_fil_rev_8_21_14_0_10_45_14]|uniref:Peptidylprolyl isomerase n=1 Tax=Candidatus Vogelbacteria bacterium CG10_big_fil_rev_8_21_14_0_10_45_14 TaxID=1975042 RepID=A0A2H0RKQ2_9BACT|nr:MAG: hypothetical protein COV07_00400 [Candidatus Vogelbacteria bacterium CG10_big_fil_rev_8_21_14_0_10_45_14]
MNKAIAIVVVILVVVLGAFAVRNNMSGQGALGATVATVNGEAVTQGELNLLLAEVNGNPEVVIPAEGTEEYKQFMETVLDQAVNNKLLLSHAISLGFKADEESVQTQLATVKGNFENDEAFQAELTKSDITEAVLVANMRRRSILGAYYESLSAENDLSVSDEEVKTFYDTQVASGEGAPSFEEIEAQIKELLSQQKGEQLLATIIADLRAKATVVSSL